jgi:hypothetical protein
MGEGFIVRRGGGGQQTVKPIYNSLTEVDFTSLTLSVTNDSNSIATLYYSVVQPEPGPTTSDTFDTEFAGKETKDITITGLTSGTTYTVYIKAIAIGEFPSETVIVTELTTGIAMSATGGTITELDITNSPTKRYRYHTFTGNGTFQVTQLSNMGSTFNQVDYLVVAGGGGGGGTYHAGGGGAGGLLNNNLSVNLQNYSITVGNGGTGGLAWTSQTPGGTGGASSIISSGLNITALGGGGGGTYDKISGTNGGSGGGEGGNGNVNFGLSTLLRFGTGTAGQGNNGGKTAGSTWSPGGGGGGAGGVGGNASSNHDPSGHFGGNGGVGLNLSANFPNWGTNSSNGTTGTRGWFAGGGGGSNAQSGQNGVYGLRGIGGGGNGSNAAGNPGLANTGGGGGGSERNTPSNQFFNGGAGGSGIVIIRYEIAPTV